MKPHRCEHGLDLRKNPRCYLCQPEGVVTWPSSVPSIPWVFTGTGTSRTDIAWCQPCFAWHAPGFCKTTITYHSDSTLT